MVVVEDERGVPGGMNEGGHRMRWDGTSRKQYGQVGKRKVVVWHDGRMRRKDAGMGSELMNGSRG